jgi:hypothetical protein
MNLPRLHLRVVFDEGLELVEGGHYMITTLGGGDPQSAWWPLVDKVYEPYRAGYGDFHWVEGSRFVAAATLASCVFDAVEMGRIPHKHGAFEIELPDGSLFDYLADHGDPYVRIQPPKE